MTSKEKQPEEILDFPKGDPFEHVSINTTVKDHDKDDSPYPPNAPPVCEDCE